MPKLKVLMEPNILIAPDRFNAMCTSEEKQILLARPPLRDVSKVKKALADIEKSVMDRLEHAFKVKGLIIGVRFRSNKFSCNTLEDKLKDVKVHPSASLFQAFRRGDHPTASKSSLFPSSKKRKATEFLEISDED